MPPLGSQSPSAKTTSHRSPFPPRPQPSTFPSLRPPRLRYKSPASHNHKTIHILPRPSPPPSAPMTLLLLPLLLLLSSTSSSSQCLPSQTSALLALTQSYDSSNQALTSWLPTGDCCHWERVLCADPASGMVTSLDLSDLDINGNLSPSLFNLTALTSLNLAFNRFNGPIPDSFHLLPKLTTLNLAFNSFTGQIPASISTLTHLISLDLSYLGISGALNASLFNLTALTSLNLSENAFTGPIPDSFHLLPKLTTLKLSYAGFTGQIPASISTLTHLISLDLSWNDLKLNDPDLRTLIKNLRGLRELYLDRVNISANVTEWGTVLSASAPRLRDLSLSGCSISGPIDSSLTGLRSLRRLVLADNELNCAVPDFIGNFTSLSELILNSCGLKGELPETISELRNLAGLDLGNNSLTGPIAPSLFSLPLLSIVDLNGNNLQGQIPSSVFNLSGLEMLDLSSNNFSGTIDLSLFASLRNLAELHLGNNRLSVQYGATYDSSLSFPTLYRLGLAACNLTNIPSLLRNQTKMEFLDLSNNRISGSIPNWIWGIPTLNLSCNFFTNVERPLPQLSVTDFSIYIDLHSNNLQGPIPLPSAHIVLLKYFSLSNNSLTGPIPPLICSADNLEALDLGFNKLTGPIPQCLMGNVTNLRVLNLEHNQLTGPISNPSLEQGCGIEILNVNGNQLSGKLPSNLINCSYLEVLDLGNNRFYDSFPLWLSNLPKLQVLVLHSNKFCGTIGSPKFPMLQVLDLSSNNFDGVLSPECFSSFQSMMSASSSTVSHPDLGITDSGSNLHYALTVIFKNQEMTLVKSLIVCIDLSDNKFEGGIPQVIGQLTSLDMLNMSHNLLTGRIPVSLRRLVQLQSLDLSSNQLSGQVPQELVYLTFLSVLNLSDNKLIGRIPQGGQLQTFDVDDFQGNEGLCGAPLVKMCSNVVSHNESTDEVVNDPSWELAVVVVSGFVTGLAVVFWGMVYWENGRSVFEEKVDRMTWALLDSVAWCGKVKRGNQLGPSNHKRRQRN